MVLLEAMLTLDYTGDVGTAGGLALAQGAAVIVLSVAGGTAVDVAMQVGTSLGRASHVFCKETKLRMRNAKISYRVATTELWCHRSKPNIQKRK